ncbi:MAG: DNA-binding protein [Planctomycetota bacterium]|nr:MAG: DNA-binding protein [Planctomycetota bacterium]
MAEFYTFEEVMQELQIDEEELKRLISQGELRGFRDGDEIKFRRDDVLNLKKNRETEPTIILTDSDHEIRVPGEEADLIVDESADKDTVVNIDVFETEEVSPLTTDDSDVPTVDIPTFEEGATDFVLADEEPIEIPDLAEVEIDGDTDAAATIIDTEPPTAGEAPATFDLVEEPDEFAAGALTGSGRISRSARLRAMTIKKKRGHPVSTVFLFLTSIIMIWPGAIIWNLVRGVEPKWIYDMAFKFRNMVDMIHSWFGN